MQQQNVICWSNWRQVTFEQVVAETRTYVVSGLLQTVFHRSILSRPMKVAMPTPCCLRYSTHCCAVFIVSTTMWSSAAHAVDTATSYFSSIAPRSPYRVTHTAMPLCCITMWNNQMTLVEITSHSIIIYWLPTSALSLDPGVTLLVWWAVPVSWRKGQDGSEGSTMVHQHGSIHSLRYLILFW